MKINKKNFQLRIAAFFISVTIFLAIGTLTSCISNGNSSSTDDMDTTSLYEAYKDNYLMGVAFGPRMLEDSMAKSIILKHFNSITSENEMKWEKIHPEADSFDFSKADQFVDFGEANNMYIVGHVLVWHSQTPDWVFEDKDGNPVSKEVLLERMENHITTIVTRYKGRVDCWDVINESFEEDGSYRQSKWYTIIGEEYIQKAFEFASKADPEAVLIYNDYSLPTATKRDGVVAAISELQKKGVKIDGIGMQGHYHLDYPSLKEFEASVEAFSKLGRVMITEMDINILPMPDEGLVGAEIGTRFEYHERLNPYTEGLSDSMAIVLADRYASFFEILNKYSESVDRVTIWGVQDGSSWLNYWPIRGRTNYPLLFDRNYQPKKAFWAVVNLPEEN